MTDRPGDIVKVKKRSFSIGRKDIGRVGVIKEIRTRPFFSGNKFAKVDFTSYDYQEPHQKVYNVKELQSVQEVRDQPSHIRKAERSR